MKVLTKKWANMLNEVRETPRKQAIAWLEEQANRAKEESEQAMRALSLDFDEFLEGEILSVESVENRLTIVVEKAGKILIENARTIEEELALKDLSGATLKAVEVYPIASGQYELHCMVEKEEFFYLTLVCSSLGTVEKA